MQLQRSVRKGERINPHCVTPTHSEDSQLPEAVAEADHGAPGSYSGPPGL